MLNMIMYLVNYIWSDIVFSIDLLATYDFSPTQTQWNGVKHMWTYFHGTINMGIFYATK